MPIKTIFFKLVTIITPASVFSFGSYYLYYTYWPKTIGDWFKNEGLFLIDENKNNHYGAMLNDHREFVDILDIDGLNKNITNTNDAIGKIKKWCKEKWSDSWSNDLKDKIIKFCIYNPQTVRGIFIGKGEDNDFIENDEDYKVVFSIFKIFSKDFIDSIVNTNDTSDVGKEKLKKWCLKELKKPIKNSSFKGGDYSKISSLCKKPDYKTIKEKIQKSSKDWEMIDDNSGDWEAAFERWKYTDEFMKILKKDNGNSSLDKDTENSVGGPKMKAWCKNLIVKKFSDDDLNITIDEYSYLKSSCKKTN